MVEARQLKSPLDLPPAERPLDFRHVSYAKIINHTEQSTEILVRLTIFIGKRQGSEFNGEIQYEYKKDECSKCESESFVDAAQKVWVFYRRRDAEIVKFIRKDLNDKWEDLKGEKLTRKKLVFNIDSDEITIS